MWTWGEEGTVTSSQERSTCVLTDGDIGGAIMSLLVRTHILNGSPMCIVCTYAH